VATQYHSTKEVEMPKKNIMDELIAMEENRYPHLVRLAEQVGQRYFENALAGDCVNYDDLVNLLKRLEPQCDATEIFYNPYDPAAPFALFRYADCFYTAPVFPWSGSDDSPSTHVDLPKLTKVFTEYVAERIANMSRYLGAINSMFGKMTAAAR
jgi:hypothetical protein